MQLKLTLISAIELISISKLGTECIHSFVQRYNQYHLKLLFQDTTLPINLINFANIKMKGKITNY